MDLSKWVHLLVAQPFLLFLGFGLGVDFTSTPAMAGDYIGSANYVYASGSNCTSLTGVKVTINVTTDLVWQSTANGPPGFSIQLNAETSSKQPLDWLQFIVHMGDDADLWPWVNIWESSGGGPSGIPSGGEFVYTPLYVMPQAGRIPANYSIVVALQYDNQGKDTVIGATWTVFDPSNAAVGTYSAALSNSTTNSVPSADLSPIASFQVTLGGAMDGGNATFSSGAGLITLQADQLLTADASYPSCIGYTNGTGETSNIAYGQVSSTPSTTLTQSFSAYTAQAQCQAAMTLVQMQNPKVTLAASDTKAFQTALNVPSVAQCENTLLQQATASLPTLACTIAKTLPLDPGNSPTMAVAAALQQSDQNLSGQFFTTCYSPYIKGLDAASCDTFCGNASNVKACNFPNSAVCASKCSVTGAIGGRPAGCPYPLVMSPVQFHPSGSGPTPGLVGHGNP
jgi:hypothetical protein